MIDTCHIIGELLIFEKYKHVDHALIADIVHDTVEAIEKPKENYFDIAAKITRDHAGNFKPPFAKERGYHEPVRN